MQHEPGEPGFVGLKFTQCFSKPHSFWWSLSIGMKGSTLWSCKCLAGSAFGKLWGFWYAYPVEEAVGYELWDLSNHLSPPTHPVLKHQGCYHWFLYLFSIGFKYKFFCHGLRLPVRKLHFPAVFGVLVSSGIDCKMLGDCGGRARGWETFVIAWFSLQPLPSRDLPLVGNCMGLRSLLWSGRNKYQAILQG